MDSSLFARPSDRPGAWMSWLNKKSLLSVLAFVKFLVRKMYVSSSQSDIDVSTIIGSKGLSIRGLKWMHIHKRISSPNDGDKISRSGIQEAPLSISCKTIVVWPSLITLITARSWDLYIAEYFITDNTFQYHLNACDHRLLV